MTEDESDDDKEKVKPEEEEYMGETSRPFYLTDMAGDGNDGKALAARMLKRAESDDLDDQPICIVTQMGSASTGLNL